MTSPKPPPIAIEPAASSRQRAVANLMELYLYELSDVDGRPIGDDGCYGYATLDAYWSDPGRYPYLFYVEAQLAGFALVMEQRILDGQSPGHLIAEFFVLRAYRRRGVGEAVATELFRSFPGPWWVCQHAGNVRAVAFWRATIGRYTGGAYEEERWTEPDGTPCVAQRFTSPGNAPAGHLGANGITPDPA